MVFFFHKESHFAPLKLKWLYFVKKSQLLLSTFFDYRPFGGIRSHRIFFSPVTGVGHLGAANDEPWLLYHPQEDHFGGKKKKNWLFPFREATAVAPNK
jgi:hypothetical protein